MSRSRSSFDLTAAIATATSLSSSNGRGPTESKQPAPFNGVALVSFHSPPPSLQPVPAPAPSPVAAPAPSPVPERSETATATAGWSGEEADADPHSDHPEPDGVPDARPQANPPKLPDLSAVVSPILRCEKIVDWIAEATGATDVFLADAAGLPLAGAVYEAESRLAATGNVAASVVMLAAAMPGSASPLFEMHVGEGPFVQLIGFQAGSALYVVGLTRATPLTPRQAHAVRLACRHALGTTLEVTMGPRTDARDSHPEDSRPMPKTLGVQEQRVSKPSGGAGR